MLKPLGDLTEVDLQELIGQQENQGIEFKRSEALILRGQERDRRVAELVKDVTAMANAAGGRIFYGVVEDRATGRAESLDEGFTAEELNADQVGNVLTGNVEPLIRGVEVRLIPLATGRNACVIDVPQATTLAPHQSRLDRKYHRRHDRSVLPMFDHEIRDVMRRSVAPEIDPEITIHPTGNSGYDFKLLLSNQSDEPVLYFTVDLLTDEGMMASVPANFHRALTTLLTPSGVVSVDSPSRNFITPHIVPLFKPRKYIIAEWSGQLLDGRLYFAAITVSAPSFHGHWMVQISCIGGRVMARIDREF